ncbi:hypothetical protein MKX01_009116 [Papaver californicum]|nr:hypothetical protein MKX01_009116 [Papaver californicum]
MFEIAPHFKALLVFLEHRYYGKSNPFGGDKEIAYSNSITLGYLSSTQALKNLTTQDSPVIIFGGSYEGMLAAWFRYPHVAMGALASSAPILGFQGIVSPYSFNNIITQDFKSIKESWNLIEETEQKHGGLNLLKKSFKLLGGWLQTAFVYTAMTDYPTPSNFLNPLPAYPIRQMCKAIDDPTARNDPFAKLYRAANIYYNSSGTATCFNLSDHSDPHGLAEWTWQACAEMILPTDGNDEKSIFPSSEWNFSDRATFRKEYLGVEPRPNWATTEFGGMDIMRVLKRFESNMIFFNGLRDPWSGGGAHHVELRFSDKEDPKWLQDVRKEEIHIIDKWIDQYYHDLSEDLSYS